jgi:hypothetical protein
MNTTLLALKQWMDRISDKACVKPHDDAYGKHLRSYTLVKKNVGLAIDTKHTDE